MIYLVEQQDMLRCGSKKLSASFPTSTITLLPWNFNEDIYVYIMKINKIFKQFKSSSQKKSIMLYSLQQTYVQTARHMVRILLLKDSN